MAGENNKNAQKYPWSLWFRRRRFTLRQGQDYSCSHSSMSQQIRNAASRRNVGVALVEESDGITVVVSNGGADA